MVSASPLTRCIFHRCLSHPTAIVVYRPKFRAVALTAVGQYGRVKECDQCSDVSLYLTFQTNKFLQIDEFALFVAVFLARFLPLAYIGVDRTGVQEN